MKNFLLCLCALFIVHTASPQQSYFDAITKPLQWRNIGPASQGGRIVDIESLDDDYRKVWAATGSGGVWYSENAGTTWRSIFDKYETASIGDIAVFQPNPNIIWVGTGEVNGRNSVSWGNGVYKSTDGGKTFTCMGLQASQTIARIVLHPSNPNIAYVAAMGALWGHNRERGLYRTEDGGATWQKLSNGLPDNDREGCIDVIMDPVNPSTLYAAYYYRLRQPHNFQSGSNNGGIFKSTDAGKSWRKLQDGLPGDSTGRIGLAICKSQPDVLMAIVEAPKTASLATPGSGIYRSDNGGDHWEYVNMYNNRPFYYSQIRLHPRDPNKVYVLTTPFMVSDNGGKTFTNGSEDEEIHGDFHAMWIDPKFPDRYYIGADKGISLTHDGGNKFILFDNLPIAQYYRIAADMRTPYRIYGGLQDNGFYATESFARDVRGILNDVSWKVHWGDGQYAAVNPNDANDVYTSSENGTIRRLNPATHELQLIMPTQFNTRNAGAFIKKGSDQPFFRFNWSAPFLLSQHDSKTLYMGAQYVLKSTDAGSNWQIISGDLSHADSSKIKTGNSGGITPDNTGAENFGTIYTLAQSPKDSKIIWAGTDDGRVHLSQDDGTSWKEANTNWPAAMKGLWIDRIVASAHYREKAYAVVDGHRSNVFKPLLMVTTDFGKTWRSLVNNLPATEVLRSFVEDAINPQLLFAGTETGIWCSIDGGNQWWRFNKNMPTVSIYDLLIHSRESDLIAATHGRSLWVMDDISYLQQLETKMMGQRTWLFAQKPVVLWENTSRGGQRGHMWYGGDNPPGIQAASSLPRASMEQTIFVTVYVSTTAGEKVQLTITDPRRQVSAVIDTALTAGVHRLPWDLSFASSKIPDAEIANIEAMVKSIPGVERSVLTALRRLQQAKTGGEQREQIARLLEANPGIPISGEYLPVKANPGTYELQLKAEGYTQNQTLVIQQDPLHK